VIDPLVKVYDIRTMRPLAPISFVAGPSFLKLHPTNTSQLFIVSQDGQIQLCDVTDRTAPMQFYQVIYAAFNMMNH
jgi:PAB-dependent poly(A)-specific ribonuclease subunit 2